MTRILKLLYATLAMLAALIALCLTVGRWGAQRYVVFDRVYPTEVREIDGSGRVTYRPISRAYPQKSMDEIGDSWAVWKDSMNWINLAIEWGDRTYAFGPSGHVFVLKAAGIDSSAVESKSIWHGDPHDYAFPKNQPKGPPKNLIP